MASKKALERLVMRLKIARENLKRKKHNANLCAVQLVACGMDPLRVWATAFRIWKTLPDPYEKHQTLETYLLLPPLVLKRKDGRREIINNFADAVRLSEEELAEERE